MAFTIKNLTVKNFMSVGNVTQAVNFDRKDLTLVLGENLDLGGDDSGARNGTGKTTICNALSYAFFGQALTNIKKDNLINKTNAKGMLVTIDFEKDGIGYRIERGRKPGVLTFYRGDVAFESKDNDAQGDSRETQHEIDRMLGMTPDMFRHIVALNTYTEPFLSLKANDQRNIIEQLLGITLLSEKAESLKEAVKNSKDTITAEEYRIKAVLEANKKIEEQILSLKRRRDAWEVKHDTELNDLTDRLEALLKIDIEAELKAHDALKLYTENEKALTDLTTLYNRVSNDRSREHLAANKLIKELRELANHKCHACEQELHGPKHQEMVLEKQAALIQHQAESTKFDAEMAELKTAIDEVKKSIGTKPTVFYKKAADAYNHKTTVEHLTSQTEGKVAEENPYNDQINEMETGALAEVDYTVINDTTRLKEHQEFLHKLLTNKDSFIRKRIIDQNLTYLNARLSYYLDKIGLPHVVIFQSDLSVSIEELGRELDFDNLSRGERGRLILSLSWAFRDVWESLYEPVNLLFVDELIDNGLDSSGVENAMHILKKMSRDAQKSVWLVSHKDELTSRVSNILRVVKDGGFTSYQNDTDDA
jgi:DNA repair exonuclease SbcCD ATPase subunit